MNKSDIFQTIKSGILAVTIFLFPLLFLPTTQEFFLTNKLYLLVISALLLLLVSLVQLLFEKKIVLSIRPLDGLVGFFLLSIGLSTLLSSPNKIQSLLNPTFGLVSMTSLVIVSYYLRRSQLVIFRLLSYSCIILSVISIFFFFQPFQKVNLPVGLQFLKGRFFNPLGITLDLSIFLGFFLVAHITQFILIKEHERSHHRDEIRTALQATLIPLVFICIAFILTIISLFNGGLGQIAPFRHSWYAAVEILKNLLTGLFGNGVDNFSSLFVKVKDDFYNQSALWQVHSFNVSRSTLLHIFTETGILGLVSFVLLMISLLREAFITEKFTLLPVGYVVIALLIFPPSLPLFFLFFVAFSMIDDGGSEEKPWRSYQINFSRAEDNVKAMFSSLLIGGFASIVIAFYFIGRSYLAEYYFKKAVDAIPTNEGRKLYDFQRRTVLTNPYIERFRISFSQTNLLIANNVAAKLAKSTGNDQQKLSAQDRETLGQAIQAAILEAKAAVALNPQKATNWENLAVIYRNLLNLAQAADSWAISSYQRAIVLDPRNPSYRFNLGGVYYAINNFDEAIRFFEQAASLKPDWSNAHYNLAWSYYRKGLYEKAYQEVQTALSLLNPKTDKADYERAKKDLKEFEKMLPKNQEEATPSSELTPRQLNLPSPPPATLEPKLELPEEASPEAE